MSTSSSSISSFVPISERAITPTREAYFYSQHTEDLLLRLEPESANPPSLKEIGYFRVVRDEKGIPLAMTRLFVSAEGKALLEDSLQKLYKTEQQNRQIPEGRFLGLNLSKLRLQVEIEQEKVEWELYQEDPEVKELLELAQLHLSDLVLANFYRRGLKGNLKASFALESSPPTLEAKKSGLLADLSSRDELLQELAELRNPELEEGIYPEEQYDLLGRIHDYQEALQKSLQNQIASQEIPEPSSLRLLQKVKNLDHFALTFAVSQEPYEVNELDLAKEKALLQALLKEPSKTGIFESVKSHLFQASNSKSLNEEEIHYVKEILAMRTKSRIEAEDTLQISSQESLEEFIFRLMKGESFEELYPILENILRNIPGMREEQLFELTELFNPRNIPLDIEMASVVSDHSSLTHTSKASSLGFLLSSASSSISSLPEEILEIMEEEKTVTGYEEGAVTGDGNCLYSSFLKLVENGEIKDPDLENSADKVQVLRNKVAAWIEDSLTQEELQVIELLEDAKKAHLEAYENKIAHEKAFLSSPTFLEEESISSSIEEEIKQIAQNSIQVLQEKKERLEKSSYTDLIRESNFYAGSLELYALSKLYDKKVRLFGKKGDRTYKDISGFFTRVENKPINAEAKSGEIALVVNSRHYNPFLKKRS